MDRPGTDSLHRLRDDLRPSVERIRAHASKPSLILVVDDDESNRMMLAGGLRNQGHAVELAEDGSEALRKIEATPYDLVMLDWMMPGLSGLEVLEILRRDLDAATLPVIVSTARGGSEDIVSAFRMGANDYVTKPLDFPVVMARVRTQLGFKRAVDENRALLRDLELRNDFIRQIFGRYLTDEIVTSLLDDRKGLALGGEKRRISILMTDLRDFSTFAERMEPDAVVRILNTYFEVMTGVIMEYGGTIDEFIGDAILVFFGAPLPREDHARAAVECAVRLQLAMEEVNDRNAKAGLPRLEMGIGVHTGEVVVGNVGSERRAKYGAVGSNVNLASRIEAYTVGGQVLVSSDTLKEAGSGPIPGRSFPVHPKGLSGPIRIHEVIGVSTGKGELRLPTVDLNLTAVTQPIPVHFLVMDAREDGAPPQRGQLTGISALGARLQGPDLPKALENVKLWFDLEDGGAEGIHAKAIGAAPDGDEVIVRFASVPPGFEERIAAWIEP